MTHFKAILILNGGEHIKIFDFGEDVVKAEEYELRMRGMGLTPIAIGEINGPYYTVIYYQAVV